MKRKIFINPAYLLAKINMWVFKRRYPDVPWLTEQAVFFLSTWLRSSDVGVEWGSGRSTVWFASKVKHLISIESNKQWYDHVKKIIGEKKISNKVELHYIPVEINEMNAPHDHPYVDFLDEISDETLDFVLVDAKLRILCMEKVLPKIKPGGLLILDNSERFIATGVMCNRSVDRLPMDTCINGRWEKLLLSLNNWRTIYTTNGVWNTQIWIKS